ncbi:predicted protein [Chaetomium globosum CBS 148.51]|uniref:Uncharacterized protein n=1 Tax=Chaetomium globosum (strain ATCC 6205 / CBS 148.51 / DSM 1962 / NBRC 6347 / NRRL 1970) TaxID=306901 RepID=Q2HDH0_CHAGB|nr:uncharacterized protein CHGG_01734 [Chaetomium globosum CBS 148.51]EAQ93499.1 predicted protein [Chaetomium globosum CBS 148.51]
MSLPPMPQILQPSPALFKFSRPMPIPGLLVGGAVYGRAGDTHAGASHVRLQTASSSSARSRYAGAGRPSRRLSALRVEPTGFRLNQQERSNGGYLTIGSSRMVAQTKGFFPCPPPWRVGRVCGSPC